MSLTKSNINQSSQQPSHSPKHNSVYNRSYINQNIFKQSQSTYRPLQKNSSDNLYVAKLESKALDIQKKIDTQIYQIETLTAQTKHFMQICEQQKQQLNNLNSEMLRQQYQEQIKQLVEEKEKVTELIYNLNQEYQQVEEQQDMTLQQQQHQNQQLTILINQALQQKETLLQQIDSRSKEHSLHEQTIFEQEQRIDQLRLIQRKLVIALKDMQSLSKQ